MKIETRTWSKLSSTMAVLTAVTLSVGWKTPDPAEARGPANGALIDVEWENAVSSHIEKRFFNLIDATDEQEKTLDALFKERLEQTRPTREKIKQGATELAQMFASPEATEQQIEDKAKEIRALRDKLADERIATVLKVRKILDPNQRKVLSDRMVNRLTSNRRHHHPFREF